MTPTERIQAAIEKLERLKSESTHTRADSEWVVDPEPGPGGVRVVDSHNGGWDGTVVADLASEADARAIVTLHRTIDAQLSILRTIADLSEQVGLGEPGERITVVQNALDLADAIIGGAE